ncbi:hypothetical protein FRC12_017990 [Ceratobasidium sp. 428]|nr:hypothetical protein FRC12_017990 [Ceratobasidium sp. 428]
MPPSITVTIYSTMRQPAIQCLPNEVLGIILELTENISAVSLVSRQFYQVAFPLVHRTLVLSHDTRVKAFVDRVSSEEDNSSLRISQALRCLIVSEKCYTGLFGDSLVLAQFRDIIPQLVNLELLSWRTLQQLNAISLLTDFQRYCTKLRSLGLKAIPRQLLADNTKIFGFRNLTQLAVEHQDDYDDDTFCLDPAPQLLLEAIRSSPLLCKLVLRLHGRAYRGPQETVNINRFFQDLNTTLPHLRHLELWSGAKLEWNPILHCSTLVPDPVRTFFMGSSNIETLIIDWAPESRINNPSLYLLRQMFPALRHFTGPEQICAIILASDLRLQLESLHSAHIIHSADSPDQNAYVNVVDVTTELPQLRALIFSINFDDEDLPPEPESLFPAMLMEYLRAAPILESLEIGSYMTRAQILNPVSATLKHANLRRLTIRLHYNANPMARNKDETAVTLATQVAMNCPQLEQLTIRYNRPPSAVYQFERDSQGRLKRILMNGKEFHTIPSH